MPTTVGFEAPARFVLRASGDLTAPEVLAAIEEMLADPRLRDGTTILTFGKDVTSVPDAIDLQTIAAASVRLTKKGIVAIASVTAPGLVYGSAQIFSVLARMKAVRHSAFTEEAEARAWLDAATGSASSPSVPRPADRSRPARDR